MSEIQRDFLYAFRRLRSRPLLVIIITASLGLGIGVVTAAFSVANAFLLRAPDYIADPETFVTVYTSDAGEEPHGPTSFPNYQSLLESAETLEDLAAVRFGIVTVGGRDRVRPDRAERPERLFVEIATGNYFDLLGVRPLLGRTFSAEESRLGSAERVVVISFDLFEERFASDPGAIGATLELDGHPWTVIGVAPPGLVSRYIPLVIDAWIPVGVPGGVYHATPARLASRSEHDFTVFGRMAQGTTLEQVQAELQVLGESFHESFGREFEDERGQARTFYALSEKDSRMTPAGRNEMAGISGLLLGATGLVLFIACSNIASLLLAQASRRQREMAVRLALGANRGRLLALSLIESLMLAVLGGGFGLLLAWLATRSLGHIPLPMGMPALDLDLSLDPRVVLFSLLLSMATCLLFGTVPALESSKPNLIPALKGETSSDGRPRRFGLRGLLVVGQIAASLVFVVAAGLLLRSVRESARVDLGFDPDGVALLSKQLPEDEYSPQAARLFFDGVREHLASLPDVEVAHLSTGVEHSLLTPVSNVEIEVPGYERSSDESLTLAHNAVTPGYLEMLSIRPLRGRTLRDRDGASAPGVAVVNESFIERFWPGAGGLGRTFRLRSQAAAGGGRQQEFRSVEVIGVVPDGQYAMSEDGTEATPFVWTSFYQENSPFVLIHARGRADAATLLPLLASEVASVPGEVSLIAPTTFRELISFQESMMRTSSQALGLAGLFGLALATIGVYGIVAFAVAMRRREWAIRQALGALPGQVFFTAAADGMILSLVGLALGLLFVLPLAALLGSQLSGVRAFDPLAIGGGCAMLLLAALAASTLPALRAVGIDVMEALRDD